MTLPDAVSRYFETWNQHDSAGIVSCFTEDGLYHDPFVPQGVGGDGLVYYTQNVFQGMPDLKFEVDAAYASDNATIVEWRMVASPNINVPGVDIFLMDGELIGKVKGYYDRKLFETQQGGS